MAHYILLLHQDPRANADLAPEEMLQMTRRYMAWADGLRAQGRMQGGEKLTGDGGRHVRLEGGRPIASDGPYAEAKDVVSGFFVIDASDLAQAEAIARDCPHLSVAPGNWIEVRPVDTMPSRARTAP